MRRNPIADQTRKMPAVFLLVALLAIGGCRGESPSPSGTSPANPWAAATATQQWSALETQLPVTSPIPVNPDTLQPVLPANYSLVDATSPVAYAGVVLQRTNHTADGQSSGIANVTGLDNGAWPGPALQWLPCPQTSQDSYVNFTFNPYPLRYAITLCRFLGGKD